MTLGAADRTVLLAGGLALVLLGCGGSATSSATRAPGDGGKASGIDASVASDDGGPDVETTAPQTSDAPSVADATDAASAVGCGAGDCPGCCSGGQCVSGTEQTACGHHGGPCADCTSLGATCTSDAGPGGACQLAAACGPNTCPMGCCDAKGICQSGTLATACGGDGTSCQTCGLRQPCEQQQCGPACSPLTCPSGCCDSAGICEPGTGGRGMCGGGRRGGCPGPACVAAPDGGLCNAQTCPSGCCDAAGNCQQGITGTACGTSGASCENCIFNDQLCLNQECVSAPDDGGSSCSPNTCPSGCCDALGECVIVSSDRACGNYGVACSDCTQAGALCNSAAGQCELPDGSVICEQSCNGCCDALGACQAGLTDTQCGAGGAPCVNCATQSPASTCDVAEQACASQQTQCPAAYPTCPALLQESVPAPSGACSTDEIQNAGAACAGGATSPACAAFFAFESSSNAACGRCLATFDFDFAVENGIRACAAPYVDATCNHNSACLVDCIADACFDCPDDPSTAQCQIQARSGTCSAFTQADGCVAQALAGPAASCNPVTYQEDFRAWLMAVGTAYCAQP